MKTTGTRLWRPAEHLEAEENMEPTLMMPWKMG